VYKSRSVQTMRRRVRIGHNDSVSDQSKIKGRAVRKG
jgi:hypothetical protein